MLDLPRHHASSTQDEEDEDEEEDNTEEVHLHDPVDETQQVFAQSQTRNIKFGDDGDLIKASVVDVDCSG